ncbi:hypothetical protein NQ317_012265 [Molorchus minor]|uniref:Uncharacterized protein n=1 Tax=Molorchus minor TaxID=1323400 RepID=A0ABQ9K1T1_9CUCU|nr:hypothetical protein NQ317_012265 [Molorchus minor]
MLSKSMAMTFKDHSLIFSQGTLKKKVLLKMGKISKL